MQFTCRIVKKKILVELKVMALKETQHKKHSKSRPIRVIRVPNP
jgi:hypothetical protein